MICTVWWHICVKFVCLWVICRSKLPTLWYWESCFKYLQYFRHIYIRYEFWCITYSFRCTLTIFLNEKQKTAFICHSICARFHMISDVAIHQTLLTFQHDKWWSSLTCTFSISTVFLVTKINTATVDAHFKWWQLRYIATQILHIAL